MNKEKQKNLEKGSEVSQGQVFRKQEILVWSLPTRLFHWTLVGSLLACGGLSYYERWLDVHISLGFLALMLISWRIYYGFFGPFYSRFTSFVFPAQRVKSYLKGLAKLEPPEYVGHNPPHGWIILGFFSVFFIIAVTGLVVFYGEENEGVLRGIFSFSAGEWSKEIHEAFAFLLGVMVLLHVSGALLDSILHQSNLVKGMITGKKFCSAHAVFPEKRKRVFSRVKGLAWLTISFLVTGGLFGTTVSTRPPSQVFAGGGEGFEVWKVECADCHELFHPSLLPRKSWDEMLNALGSHFGEDASLEKRQVEDIRRFLHTYSAENSPTEAAYKIRTSLKKNEKVIRITDTPYWKQKHEEIGGDVYKRKSIRRKTHCRACHTDAESGGYKDSSIRVPAA
ncbi:MAG: cytochrome b/b6 domain-containing protein [Nitrospinota bacterium]